MLHPSSIAACMSVADIPVEFLLFIATLLGIALWHRHAMRVAVAGVLLTLSYKLTWTGFAQTASWPGLWLHLTHEWVILANLLALLSGFALLARHFELSGVPQWLPAWLPDDWRGGFWLLSLVWLLSAFLDNIAAALIGGSVAKVVYRNRLHVGYVVALVAAANAGGAGSVVGDTTTTMMWLSGISPLQVLRAVLPALIALLVFGVLAARQQQAYAPIEKDPIAGTRLDRSRLLVVTVILCAAVLANIAVNMLAPALGEQWPCMGIAVWLAILATARWCPPDWSVLPGALKGALFLLSLVLLASLMPVARLPAPTLASTFALGGVSAVFDNIPLTKLALQQGGYDWGLLAYVVGVGGSMSWFGSSAGVALCGQFPQARSVTRWVCDGWPVLLAYVAGFVVYVLVFKLR